MIPTSTSPKARFITFEGIDGCGKSTQARRLVEKLNHDGVKTILVREPGGTRISEEIRQVLLNRKTSELSDHTEALLMTASRAQLTQEVILPSLGRGTTVVADRYSDSTLAYQGGGRGLDMEWLIHLNRFATAQLEPDVTFLVDVIAAEALRRRGVSQDRIEQAGLDLQVKVRNTYLELADRFAERMLVLDGHQPEDEIAEQVWYELKRRQIF